MDVASAVPSPLRRWLLLLFCVCAVSAACAQQQRSLDDDSPQVAGAAHKKPPKQRGPRAISVLEWTPKPEAPAAVTTPATAAVAAKPPDAPAPSIEPTAARIVPVTVFYKGEYQDAGVYMSQPAPLALRADNVYEVEQAGDPLGFFTVRDSTREHDDWIGTGQWSALLPGERPDDRSGDYTKPGTAKKNSVTVKDSDEDTDKPSLRKKKATVKGKHGVPAAEKVEIPDPGADPDRPRLHHVEAADTSLPELQGFPPDMHQTVAVSDGDVVDERVFAHEFARPQDRADALAQMQQIALSMVKAVTVQQTAKPAQATTIKDQSSSDGPPRIQYKNAPPSASAAKRTPAAHARKRTPVPVLGLENVRFNAYDLAYNDEPTYVLTARTNEAEGRRRYVAVIATPDIYGKLQVAWSSATGDSQLDIAPRYHLVDAVDASGNGRADVLLESRDATTRKFSLFEVYRGTARQIFTTGPVL